jgi:hypothetical protein
MPVNTEIAAQQKILLINPNTSEETTLKLSETLQPLLPAGFGLAKVPATSPAKPAMPSQPVPYWKPGQTTCLSKRHRMVC